MRSFSSQLAHLSALPVNNTTIYLGYPISHQHWRRLAACVCVVNIDLKFTSLFLFALGNFKVLFITVSLFWSTFNANKIVICILILRCNIYWYRMRTWMYWKFNFCFQTCWLLNIGLNVWLHFYNWFFWLFFFYNAHWFPFHIFEQII